MAVDKVSFSSFLQLHGGAIGHWSDLDYLTPIFLVHSNRCALFYHADCFSGSAFEYCPA
jgi:hypothetical protein